MPYRPSSLGSTHQPTGLIRSTSIHGKSYAKAKLVCGPASPAWHTMIIVLPCDSFHKLQAKVVIKQCPYTASTSASSGCFCSVLFFKHNMVCHLLVVNLHPVSLSLQPPLPYPSRNTQPPLSFDLASLTISLWWILLSIPFTTFSNHEVLSTLTGEFHC